MSINKNLIILSLILIITMITGCGIKQRNLSSNNTISETQNVKESEKRVIIDLDGKEVTIPAKIDRVATNGALNQIVMMLGGGEKIVATSEAVQKSFFATVYPRIKEVPAAFGGAGPGVMNKASL